eukprot:UN05996
MNDDNKNIKNHDHDQVNKERESGEDDAILFVLNVTTKNCVSVLFSSISACLVAFWWTSFDYILEQNYLTLLIPLNMFAIDCIINSLCVYLLFQFGNDVYAKVCSKCDHCCKQLLFCVCVHK